MLPNLQSTMMLHSMAASDAEYHPRSFARGYGPPRTTADDLLHQVSECAGVPRKCSSLHHLRLQPPLHEAAASIAYGNAAYSGGLLGLQPTA